MTEEPVGPQQATALLAEVESHGNRLHFHWGLGNEIFCCSTLHKYQNDTYENDDSEHVSTSTCIRWGQLGGVHRRIAYDICSKYMEYASCKYTRSRRKGRKGQHLTEGGGSQEGLEFAQSVSDILGANTLCPVEDSDDACQILEEKALWELVCSFVFDSAITEQSSSSIPDISSWYRANATALCGGVDRTPVSTELVDFMQNIDIPELEDRYWATFLRLVALGWISDALDFLGLHTAWLQWDSSNFDEMSPVDGSTPPDIVVLENISSILRRFPTLRDKGPAGPSMTRQYDSVGELMSFRQSWLKKCLDLKNDPDMWSHCDQRAPETSKACLECLQILLGEEKAIKTSVISWSELLIANIVHKYPDLDNLSELKHVLQTCLVQLPPTNAFQESVASVVGHSCEMNHQGIIKACSFTVSDWFLGHITSVLEAHPSGPGPLKRDLLHAGGNQSEFYRLDYASSLSPSPLTWELAAKYFGFCESHGKYGFEILLSNLPLSADGKLAHRAVTLAENYSLEHLKYVVYRKQGALCWQNGLYGLGAHWFSLAEDIHSMDVCLGGIVFDESDDPCKERLKSIEQSIRSLRVPKDLHYASNYALITTKICARKKTKDSFELAVATLRRVGRQLGIRCAQQLLDSILALEPGYLDRDDLILLMEYINASEGNTMSRVASRKKLLGLIALLDIRPIK